MRNALLACVIAFGLPGGAAAAEQGVASFYHDPHAGGLTAAHKSLPKGSQVRVLNLDNGRSTAVRIVDRGPYVRGRILDVSPDAAAALGFRKAGVAHVRIDRVAPAETPPANAAAAASAALICRADADGLDPLQGHPADEQPWSSKTLGCEASGWRLGRSGYPALASMSLDVGSPGPDLSLTDKGLEPTSLTPAPDASVARDKPALNRGGGARSAACASTCGRRDRPASNPVQVFFARLRRLL